jgi:HAMP domain-containing protein
VDRARCRALAAPIDPHPVLAADEIEELAAAFRERLGLTA